MRDRLIAIIEKTTRDTRRYSDLEKRTGIPATSWKKFYLGHQRATEQMIEAICTSYPDCVLWLTTGQTDEGGGQVNIDGHLAMKAHSLASIQKKPVQRWTSTEAMVVQISHAIALRSYETRDLASQVGRLSDALTAYLKNTASRDTIDGKESETSIVQVKRTDGETHVNIPHAINLREPYTEAEFEWGYHGTGPRELAANVLFHFGSSVEDAKLLAAEFSRDVISKLNHYHDWIHQSEVDFWLKRTGQEILRKLRESNGDNKE